MSAQPPAAETLPGSDGIEQPVEADGARTRAARHRRRLRKAPRRDYRCGGCGYGIRVDVVPFRCPMCGSSDSWRSQKAPS